MIKLSIITPYYNCLEYTKRLAKILEPQLTDETEWIIIDDGCHEQELNNFKARVIHLPENSGCAGIPRNWGLIAAKGKFITFIDADDSVSSNFISKILNKIDTSTFDYCLFNWRSANNFLVVDVTNGRPDWNCSVWGVVYKAKNLKNIKFNNHRFGEDYDFNLQALKGKEEKITDEFLYIYNSNPNGITASGGK